MYLFSVKRFQQSMLLLLFRWPYFKQFNSFGRFCLTTKHFTVSIGNLLIWRASFGYQTKNDNKCRRKWWRIVNERIRIMIIWHSVEMQIGLGSPFDHLIEVNAVTFRVAASIEANALLAYSINALMSKPQTNCSGEYAQSQPVRRSSLPHLQFNWGGVTETNIPNVINCNPWICIMNDLWTDYGTLLIRMYVSAYFFVVRRVVWLLVVWLLCLLLCSWHWRIFVCFDACFDLIASGFHGMHKNNDRIVSSNPPCFTFPD